MHEETGIRYTLSNADSKDLVGKHEARVIFTNPNDRTHKLRCIRAADEEITFSDYFVRFRFVSREQSLVFISSEAAPTHSTHLEDAVLILRRWPPVSSEVSASVEAVYQFA